MFHKGESITERMVGKFVLIEDESGAPLTLIEKYKRVIAKNRVNMGRFVLCYFIVYNVNFIFLLSNFRE